MESILPWLPSIVWGVLCILFIVAEALTAGIVSIWFVGGSLVALLVALIGGPIWLQGILFLGVSVGLLVGCRKMITGKFGKEAKKLDADMDLNNIVGKSGHVTETILKGKTGLVHVDGIQWTARTISQDEELPENTRIVVCKKEGNVCIVEKAEY